MRRTLKVLPCQRLMILLSTLYVFTIYIMALAGGYSLTFADVLLFIALGPLAGYLYGLIGYKIAKITKVGRNQDEHSIEEENVKPCIYGVLAFFVVSVWLPMCFFVLI